MVYLLSAILLIISSPMLLWAEELYVHQRVVVCFQEYSSDCEDVCLTCHENTTSREDPRISDQKWNPLSVTVDDRFPGFYPDSSVDDFWEELPKEHQSCRSCHAGHSGPGEHPIGMEVPDSEQLVVEERTGEGVRYFNGLLLCATCHDPHSQALHLLRINNRGSRLCFACHNK